MKRVIAIILLISLLLCGCGGDRTESTDGFLFYFPPEDPYGDKAFPTVEKNYGQTVPGIDVLLADYLVQQPPEGGKSLIPKSWSFSSYELQTGGLLVLYFSGTETSAVEESLTLACMARTFSRVGEVKRIKLCPPGEREPLFLSVEDLLLEDMGMFPREELVLYFPDEKMRYLQRETRVVDSLGEEDKPLYILNCLLEEAVDGKTQGCIPPDTKLLRINVENGVCTVDLSSEFVSRMSHKVQTARLAVYSIVNSLTELEGIKTVDIHVAHSSLEQLGLMDLSMGLQRDESLFARSNGYDGSIYPYAVDSELLVEVPVWLPGNSDYSLEEQLVRALLDYEGDHMIRHSIPRETSLLYTRMAEDTCIVDLTAAFTDRVTDLQSQTLAVRSIVATLSSLPHVKAVEILVEGNRPQYYRDYKDVLGDVRTVSEDWFRDGER